MASSVPTLFPTLLSLSKTPTDTPPSNRGLEFTALAISQNLSSPADELSTSFRNAYSSTLKPHHSFLIKPVFSAAMSACPYRKDFYTKLGEDPEKVAEELKVWLAALEKIVAILKGFLERKEAKW
jgi:hypothetical protein